MRSTALNHRNNHKVKESWSCQCGWQVRGSFEGELFDQNTQTVRHIRAHQENEENLIVKWINEDLARRAGASGRLEAAGRQQADGGDKADGED